MSLRGLVIAVLLLAPAPARAWEPDAAALARLARGRPVVEVRAAPGGAAGLIRAAIEIDAAPEVVWSVLVDCALAPRMVANLKSCRVLQADPAGAWDVREHVSRAGLLPSVRSVFRSDYDPPRRLSFHRAGGDLKALEGEWRLIALDDGARTRVIYENLAAMPYPVPGLLARIVLRHDVPQALAALRRESLAARGRRMTRGGTGSKQAP